MLPVALYTGDFTPEVPPPPYDPTQYYTAVSALSPFIWVRFNELIGESVVANYGSYASDGVYTQPGYLEQPGETLFTYESMLTDGWAMPQIFPAISGDFDFTDFTFEFVGRPDLIDDRTLFHNGDMLAGGALVGHRITLRANGEVDVWFWNAYDDYRQSLFMDIVPGELVHIVVQLGYPDKGVKFFKNGRLMFVSNWIWPARGMTTQPISFGQTISGSNQVNWLAGIYDEGVVYDRRLTHAEINSLSQALELGPEMPEWIDAIYTADPYWWATNDEVGSTSIFNRISLPNPLYGGSVVAGYGPGGNGFYWGGVGSNITQGLDPLHGDGGYSARFTGASAADLNTRGVYDPQLTVHVLGDFSAATVDGTIVGEGARLSGHDGWGVVVASADEVKMIYYSTAGWQVGGTSSGMSLSTGTVFITCKIDWVANTVRFYRNGVFLNEATLPVAGPPNASYFARPFCYGAWRNYAVGTYTAYIGDGRFDDVIYFPYALDDTVIATHGTLALATPTPTPPAPELHLVSAPLLDNIASEIGSYTTTGSRNVVACVENSEGYLCRAKALEQRFPKTRRVENLNTNSEFVSSYSGYSVTFAPNRIMSPNGRMQGDIVYFNDVTAVVFRGAAGRHTAIAGHTYTYSIYLKTLSGDPDFKLRLSRTNGTNWTGAATSPELTVTGEWQRFQLTYTVPAPDTLSDPYLGANGLGYNMPATGRIAAWGMMVEDVTYNTNQVASEYVSYGMLSAPYEGLGADGVATFTTENDNTVLDNIVTEAVPGVALTGTQGYFHEGAITQLAHYSEDIANAYWLKLNTAITSNAVTDPSTSILADKIVPDGTTGDHGIYKTGFVTTAALPYIYSVFAKAAELDAIQICGDGDDTTQMRATFNLATGAVHSTGSSATAGIIPYADGWYRCWVRVVADDATAGMYVNACAVADLISAGDTNTYAGDTVSGLYAWGLQIEQNEEVSSYVPASTADVVRPADAITMGYTAPLNDWTCAITWEPTRDVLETGVLLETRASTTTGFSIRYDGVNLTLRKRVASVDYSATIALAAVKGTEYRIVGRISSTNGVDIWLNGVKGTGNADTSNLSSAGTSVVIGSEVDFLLPTYGIFTDLQVYETDYPDGVCAEL